MLELAEKFFCSHRYQLEPAPPPPNPPPPPPPVKPLKPPPPEDQPPPPPPKPIGVKTGPVRPDEYPYPPRRRLTREITIRITTKTMKNKKLGGLDLPRRSVTVVPLPLYSPRIALKIESIPAANPPS